MNINSFLSKKFPKKPIKLISLHNMQPNMFRILEKIHVGSVTGSRYGSEKKSFQIRVYGWKNQSFFSFRNFLLAERILRSCDCSPVSSPPLPPTHQHPMWEAWDLALDMCLSQLQVWSLSHCRILMMISVADPITFLVRIRIRRFMPLANGSGSGSGSGSCYFRYWPSRRQQKTNYYFLKVHLRNFSKIKSRKEVTKQ